METLKQQPQAKAQRIRRFERRGNFFHQSKLYRENAKKFYKELGKKSIEINEPSKIEEVESFWGNIWEKQKSYNKNATWLNQIETENIEVNYQGWPQINLEETKSAIKKASNWKYPGKDGITNFWIKNLPSLH